ncbi:MAG TPA: hypothetical protein DDW52_00140 [Planctomycetaceae bacterium]|nr:hypothetical protein [Planctomycetaceae bacterium]
MTDPNRLSQIETLWSVVYGAHGADPDKQSAAQHELISRYGSAIERYLLGALKDQTAADDAYQDFVLKFLKGDFHKANPEKGRFRNFLKVVLSRLVADHYRRGIRRPTRPLDSAVQVVDDRDEQQREQEFLKVWRDEMLTRAWHDLGEEEQRTGKPWMRVLWLRVENPQWRSEELAAALSEQTGQEYSSARLRVVLHRSRERFSNYLIQAVANTLPVATNEAIEEELAELELLQYCSAAVEQRKRGASESSQADSQDLAAPPQTDSHQRKDD